MEYELSSSVGWAELFQFLTQSCQSADPPQREVNRLVIYLLLGHYSAAVDGIVSACFGD